MENKTIYPPGAYPPTQMPMPGYPQDSNQIGAYPLTQPPYQPPSQGYPPGPPLQGYPGPHEYPHGPPVQEYPSYPNYPPHQPEMPLIVQPTFQPPPQQNFDVPQGLEYLSMIDQLLVHQKVELLEVFTGFETANKYSVKNSLGQIVYYAAEDSDCCSRNCCGPIRPFEMNILDNFGTEVIHLHRPLACDSCWFPCCLQTLEVSAPPGNVVGTVEQCWSIFCPKFVIKNASGDIILRIEGPFCTSSCCCGDVEFQVLSSDGNTQVGKITKQWSGLAKEIFTDADNFGITFPVDLDVKMKAVMLGACFLIDFMFFETTREKGHDGPGMWG